MTPEQILAHLETAIEGKQFGAVPALAAHAQAVAAVLAARSQQSLAIMAALDSPLPLTSEEALALRTRLRANLGLLPTTDTEGTDR